MKKHQVKKTPGVLKTRSFFGRVVVIATRNRGKFAELADLLRMPGVVLRSLRAYPRAPRVVEDGRTFEANARQKALTIARATGCLTVGDDSGLLVDALCGAPGVRSARFAGASATDARNNAKLLRLLRRVPPRRRGAAFYCALAVADPAGWVRTVEGACRGRISDAPRGRHGFGYDPLFLIPRHGRTFGELGPPVKRRMSHRARAARRARLIVAGYLARLAARPARRLAGTAATGRPPAPAAR